MLYPCSGYFYGLPEMPIEEININNSEFSFKEDAKEDTPAMMSFAEVCLKRGFVFKNVKNINLKNIKVEGFVGKQIDIEGNENYKYE